MKTTDAMHAAIDASGMSSRAVSVKMGKSANYVSAVIASSRNKGGGVYSATLANLADVCGYALALVPVADLPDTAITVDPPERGGDE